MKKVITLFSLFCVLLIDAQEFQCHQIIDQPMARYNEPTNNPVPIDPNKKYVINVFFHIFNDDNGGNNIGQPYGIVEVMRAVRALNVYYNPYNIYFKYIGFNKQDNSALTNSPYSIPQSMINLEALNLIFANSGGSGSSSGFVGNILSAYSYPALETPWFDFAIIHEIGHNLNLWHIFQNAQTEYCEHVTRNPLDPNYNANYEGDAVADTPAQPILSASQFDGCEYIYNPSNVDCQGTPYEDIVRGNFMGYTVDINSCLHLTPGQVERIKQNLENPVFSTFLTIFNEVSSLYEPYEELLVPGDTIVSTDESPNGEGVLVCRNYVFKRKYQQGFDYHFTGTEPTDSIFVDSDTLFTYNDRTNHSINVAINQIDPNLFVTSSTVETLLPYSCSVEPYVSGTLYSMEVLGSMNITIQELTEIQVKDPQIYEALMRQYYNILKKTTESGIVKEKVIYKY